MTLSKTEDEIKDEIRYLCNFSEKKIDGPTLQISYLNYFEEKTIEEQLKAKSQNRELAIDIITGEKKESSWSNKVDIPIADNSYTTNQDQQNRLGVKILSMNLQAAKFTSYKDLHTNIINYIENYTQGHPILKNVIRTFDLTISNDISKTSIENYEHNQRAIISKLLSCINYIAMTSRVGAGTTLVVHPETLSKYFYLDKQLTSVKNFTLIESKLISKDKFIVLRADINGGNEDGLFVIKSIDTNQYFMKETPSLKNRIMWFYIK